MVSKKIDGQDNKNDSIWKHDVDEWKHRVIWWFMLI